MPKNLKFIKQNQPKFIRQFKEKVGLKPTDDVEDKREKIAKLDDRPDNDEEQPVVVVLKEGHLTKEEADLDGLKDGKIMFQKPGTKRGIAESVGKSSTKKQKTEINTDVKPNNKPKKKDKKDKRKQITKLSFDMDDEVE